MNNVSAPPSVAREAVRLDLRPLHSALAQADGVPRILDVCQATAVLPGGALWVAACIRPHPATYVCGSVPVLEGDLVAILAAMQEDTLGASSGGPDRFAISAHTHWRDPEARPCALDLTQYAQADLIGNRMNFGLLRVLAQDPQGIASCDRDAVEAVMCAAAPHIVLTLQQEVTRAREDSIVGFYPPDRFMRRVEGEVDRVQKYGTEFSLVILEVQVSPTREPGELTCEEVQAIADVLARCLRTSDLACRLADGQFGILLPLTNQRNALIACARVIDGVRGCPVFPPRLECRTGVSGWTFDAPSATELFRQASQAVQDARAAGASGAFVFL